MVALIRKRFIRPILFALAMHFIKLIFTFVQKCVIRASVFALAMEHVFKPFAIVFATILPNLNALTFFLIINDLTFIKICLAFNSFNVTQLTSDTLYKLTIKKLFFCCKSQLAIAMEFVVVPLAIILVACAMVSLQAIFSLTINIFSIESVSIGVYYSKQAMVFVL